jgi:hypothetical protein
MDTNGREYNRELTADERGFTPITGTTQRLLKETAFFIAGRTYLAVSKKRNLRLNCYGPLIRVSSCPFAVT